MNSPESTSSILNNTPFSLTHFENSSGATPSPEGSSSSSPRLSPVLFSDVFETLTEMLLRRGFEKSPQVTAIIENQELAELRKSSEEVARNTFAQSPAHGAIGSERASKEKLIKTHAVMLGQLQSPIIVNLQNGLRTLNGLQQQDYQEVLNHLCNEWQRLPTASKTILFSILAGFDRAQVHEHGSVYYYNIKPNSGVTPSTGTQLILLLGKLFKNADNACDAQILRSFFQNCSPSLTSPFTIALLRAMPGYPLEIQGEIWEAYLLKNRIAVERNEKCVPFFKAYLFAASRFIVQSFEGSNELKLIAQSIYQQHLFHWKKNLAEVVISKGGLTENSLEHLGSLFHPEYIDYENLDLFEADVRHAYTMSGTSDPASYLGAILESGITYIPRRDLDLRISNLTLSFIKSRSCLFSTLLKKIDRLNLTKTAIVVLNTNDLSIKEQEQLLTLYFPTTDVGALLNIPRYRWDVANLPFHSLRTLVHAHFRSVRALPRFGHMDFVQKIALCHAFITTMSQLQFSMDDIRKNLLAKFFPENTLIALYNQSPRSYKRLLIPYCAALLYNQNHAECAKVISSLIDTSRGRKTIEADGNEIIVNELEALQLHALAINGPSREASDLFDKTMNYIQADPNRIYSILFTNLLSISSRIGKAETIEAMLQAKIGSAPVSMEAISWLGYQDKIRKDSTGVEFLHEKSLETYVPNNLPFIILKLSLLLHLKQFEKANIEIQAYELLIPEYPFDYLLARAYLDPSYPSEFDTNALRINMFLNEAFLKNPKWIDISIASWLLNCQNSSLGISKEEFCSRISFYEHSRFSEVLHLLKDPYEKPLAFANRLENLIKVDKIAPHEILSCFSKAGKKIRNISS